MGRYARGHSALRFQTRFLHKAYNRLVATSVRGITSLTVVVPSYNEAATLRTNVNAIRAFLAKRTLLDLPWSILIVDDSSSDQTPEIAAELAREDGRIRLIRRSSNGGVDAAIRSGVEAVESDAVVVLDADLSYPVTIIESLVETLVREEADVVVASAYAPGGGVRNVPRARALLSRWANRFLAYAIHERVRTLTCIVRGYRAQALARLVAYRPDGDATHQLLLDALRLGLRVREIPATLEWTHERRSRMSMAAIARRTRSVLGAALRERPSLALAIPALIPGVLPLTIALAVLAHGTALQVGIVASTTFVVQTASTIVLCYHSTNFALRPLMMRRTTAHGPMRNST